MGTVYAELNDKLREFVEAQQMFFVATAPVAEGHINLSPKGLESFAVLDAHTVAYLDLAGSGIETVAHLRENGRIVIMFCAFDGAPKIVRLYGRGRVVEPADPQWSDYSGRFQQLPGTRSIIVVDLERVSDSCGFGVPRYEYVGQRTQLTDYGETKGPEKLEQYKAQHNRESIDGLPGLRVLAASE
ncbi:MAG: pyridoxamine 5'-phosphate oxidase family protein [Planctomycetota bacterium]|nr:MAG: pyridoxamine 5'-phosphate oxidase family protein [Planctomycetota bacterium]